MNKDGHIFHKLSDKSISIKNPFCTFEFPSVYDCLKHLIENKIITVVEALAIMSIEGEEDRIVKLEKLLNEK